MTHEELLQRAGALGLKAAIVPAREVPTNPEFRKYCEENRCKQYNANYSCPPLCGTTEEMEEKLASRNYALVLQSTWPIDDYENAQAIREAKRGHNALSLTLADEMRAAGVPCTMVGTGNCTLCNPCAHASGEPCRFPERRFSCMSAYCVVVQPLAEKCGMNYQWKPKDLSLYGMILFD